MQDCPNAVGLLEWRTARSYEAMAPAKLVVSYVTAKEKRALASASPEEMALHWYLVFWQKVAECEG